MTGTITNIIFSSSHGNAKTVLWKYELSPCCCWVCWILKPPNPLRPVVPNPVPNPVVPVAVPVPSPEENPNPLFCVLPNRPPKAKDLDLVRETSCGSYMLAFITAMSVQLNATGRTV